MTAAELRSLSEELSWHVGQTFTPQHKATFAQAAELIELLAWAEENRRCPQYEARATRPPYWSVMYRGDQYHGDTLIDTLRRAREASK